MTFVSSISRLEQKKTRTNWLTRTLHLLQHLFVLSLGVAIATIAYTLFQVPYNIAAGGVGGIGIIVNHFAGWPVGIIYLVLNIPLIILGFFYLGRWPFVFQTLYAVALFSILADLILRYLPYVLAQLPLTDDVFLSAVYAGVVGGVGGGLIYRAGATMGGTGIIGRVIQRRTGVPLSQIYLYTDGLIVVTAGIIFGWELALYALLTLLLGGMASDYILEGPSRARTATIVTTKPEEMKTAVMAELGRGISYWDAVGGYSNAPRTVMMCTFYRPQLADLKRVVARIDPDAFVSIGVTQQAIGAGFSTLTR